MLSLCGVVVLIWEALLSYGLRGVSLDSWGQAVYITWIPYQVCVRVCAREYIWVWCVCARVHAWAGSAVRVCRYHDATGSAAFLGGELCHTQLRVEPNMH